jgi:hypothetical protein
MNKGQAGGQIPASQNVIADSINIPASFRVSHIATDAIGAGQTGTVVGTCDHRNPAFGESIDFDHETGAPLQSMGNVAFDDERDRNFWIDVEPKTIDGSDLQPATEMGDEIYYRVKTAGASTSDVGSSCMWVTGFHIDRPHGNRGKYASSGVDKVGGPASGYYCEIPLINLAALSGVSGPSALCHYIVPFACRLMAVHYDLAGITYGSGASVQVAMQRNGGNLFHSALSISANGRVNVDVNSGTALTAAERPIAQGDQLNLMLTGTHANDVIPINSVSAHALVWVQGHVMADPAND